MKITFKRFILTLPGLAISAFSFAQTENYTASHNSGHSPATSAVSYSAPAEPVSTTAVEEGFVKRCPQATNARWTRLEKGFQASFVHSGQKITAVFSDQGKFNYSITELSAGQIPTEVSTFIQQQYPGHSLIQAVWYNDCPTPPVALPCIINENRQE